MKLHSATWFYFYLWRRRQRVDRIIKQVQAKGLKNAQRIIQSPRFNSQDSIKRVDVK